MVLPSSRARKMPTGDASSTMARNFASPSRSVSRRATDCSARRLPWRRAGPVPAGDTVLRRAVLLAEALRIAGQGA
jgi:hypothetical protein